MKRRILLHNVDCSSARKAIFLTLCILIVSVFVATILLSFSFSLPNSQIYAHVRDSIDTFTNEEEVLIDNTTVTQIDFFSEEIMLNSASYVPTAPFKNKDYTTLDRALLVPHAIAVDGEGGGTARRLNAILQRRRGEIFKLC